MSKAKLITNTIVRDDHIQKVIFKYLAGSLMILSVCYIYFIGSITFNVLARQSLANTVRVLGSHVGELELSYLSESNSIDKNYALTHGFVDTHQIVFATRTVTSVAIR